MEEDESKPGEWADRMRDHSAATRRFEAPAHAYVCGKSTILCGKFGPLTGRLLVHPSPREGSRRGTCGRAGVVRYRRTPVNPGSRHGNPHLMKFVYGHLGSSGVCAGVVCSSTYIILADDASKSVNPNVIQYNTKHLSFMKVKPYFLRSWRVLCLHRCDI